MPFDQHFLLASVAPNFLSVVSATEDDWACPENELLSCIGASPAFNNSFVCDKKPETGDKLHQGDIGYFLRKGRHFFGREDWNFLMEFIRKKNSAIYASLTSFEAIPAIYPKNIRSRKGRLFPLVVLAL